LRSPSLLRFESRFQDARCAAWSVPSVAVGVAESHPPAPSTFRDERDGFGAALSRLSTPVSMHTYGDPSFCGAEDAL